MENSGDKFRNIRIWRNARLQVQSGQLKILRNQEERVGMSPYFSDRF
jgi:hypothetical protein